MVQVLQSAEFKAWLRDLRDRRGAARIAERLTRVAAGHLGDVKFFGGVGELRIDYGPGYRLYFARRGDAVIVLLCGGDKSSQKRDIKRAMRMAEEDR